MDSNELTRTNSGGVKTFALHASITENQTIVVVNAVAFCNGKTK